MKRLKRWCMALTALLLCVSLCGCNELDQMQAAHGIRVDKKTISWNGYTYTLLEGYWTGLMAEHAGSVFVTEPDVPVLLSQMFGEIYSVNSGGTLLSTYFTYHDEILGEAGEKIFCRSDLLEWLEDAFINGYDLETYKFEYWDEAAGDSRVYTPTADQMKAVETVLKTVDPFAVEEYYPSDDSCITLYGYSAHGLFVEHIGWIDYIDGYYYIFRENGHEGYGWNEDCYIVPEDLYPVFDSIMDAKAQENPVANSNPTAVYPPSFFT